MLCQKIQRESILLTFLKDQNNENTSLTPGAACAAAGKIIGMKANSFNRHIIESKKDHLCNSMEKWSICIRSANKSARG